MKAHDVRHLRPCGWCSALGDSREMITATVQHKELSGEHLLHPSCAWYVLRDGIHKLPHRERMKFRLSDVPPKAMRRLIEESLKP